MLNLLETIKLDKNKFLSLNTVTEICDWVENEIETAAGITKLRFEVDAASDKTDATSLLLSTLNQNLSYRVDISDIEKEEQSDRTVADYVLTHLLFFGACAALLNKYRGKEYTFTVSDPSLTTWTICLTSLNYSDWIVCHNNRVKFSFNCYNAKNKLQKEVVVTLNINGESTEAANIDEITVDTATEFNTNVISSYLDYSDNVKLTDINIDYFIDILKRNM